MSKINLYITGGGAAKTAAHLKKDHAELFNVIYIDSDDESEYIPYDHKTHIVETESGHAGFGGVRNQNTDRIEDICRQILVSDEGKPADKNIILSSLAGGTGSTITPILSDMLVRDGHSIVIMATGTLYDGILAATNTYNTLTELISVCDEHDVNIPVMMALLNSKGEYGVMNKALTKSISQYATLSSDSIVGIDPADVKTVLNPCKNVSVVPSGPLGLIIVDNSAGIDDPESLETVMVIKPNQDATSLIPGAEPFYAVSGTSNTVSGIIATSSTQYRSLVEKFGEIMSTKLKQRKASAAQSTKTFKRLEL